MNKNLLRLVSLLLIPCLIGDPSTLSAVVNFPPRIVPKTPLRAEQMFGEQALVGYLLSDHFLTRWTGRFHTAYSDGLEWYVSSPYADQTGSVGRKVKKIKSATQLQAQTRTKLSLRPHFFPANNGGHDYSKMFLPRIGYENRLNFALDPVISALAQKMASDKSFKFKIRYTHHIANTLTSLFCDWVNGKQLNSKIELEFLKFTIQHIHNLNAYPSITNAHQRLLKVESAMKAFPGGRSETEWNLSLPVPSFRLLWNARSPAQRFLRIEVIEFQGLEDEATNGAQWFRLPLDSNDYQPPTDANIPEFLIQVQASLLRKPELANTLKQIISQTAPKSQIATASLEFGAPASNAVKLAVPNELPDASPTSVEYELGLPLSASTLRTLPSGTHVFYGGREVIIDAYLDITLSGRQALNVQMHYTYETQGKATKIVFFDSNETGFHKAILLSQTLRRPNTPHKPLGSGGKFVRRDLKGRKDRASGVTALTLAILTAAVGMIVAGLGWGYLHATQSVALSAPPTPQTGHPLVQIIWMSLVTLVPAFAYGSSQFDFGDSPYDPGNLRQNYRLPGVDPAQLAIWLRALINQKVFEAKEANEIIATVLSVARRDASQRRLIFAAVLKVLKARSTSWEEKMHPAWSVFFERGINDFPDLAAEGLRSLASKQYAPIKFFIDHLSHLLMRHLPLAGETDPEIVIRHGGFDALKTLTQKDWSDRVEAGWIDLLTIGAERHPWLVLKALEYFEEQPQIPTSLFRIIIPFILQVKWANDEHCAIIWKAVIDLMKLQPRIWNTDLEETWKALFGHETEVNSGLVEEAFAALLDWGAAPSEFIDHQTEFLTHFYSWPLEDPLQAREKISAIIKELRKPSKQKNNMTPRSEGTGADRAIILRALAAMPNRSPRGLTQNEYPILGTHSHLEIHLFKNAWELLIWGKEIDDPVLELAFSEEGKEAGILRITARSRDGRPISIRLEAGDAFLEDLTQTSETGTRIVFKTGVYNQLKRYFPGKSGYPEKVTRQNNPPGSGYSLEPPAAFGGDPLTSPPEKNNSPDGFIRQGDVAFRQMVKNIQQKKFEDVTDNKQMLRDIRAIQRRTDQTLEELAGSQAPLRIIATDLMALKVKGKEDFCAGFYSHGDAARKELIAMLGREEFKHLFPQPTLVLSRQMLDPENPAHIRQEYIFHETRCHQVGHYVAIFEAQKIFPENYQNGNYDQKNGLKYERDKKLTTINVYKGALKFTLREIIQRQLKRRVLEKIAGKRRRVVDISAQEIARSLSWVLTQWSEKIKMANLAKTPRWMLLEDLKYLPNDLPSLKDIQTTQDLRNLLDKKALLIIPWETLYEIYKEKNPQEKQSDILRYMIKELALMVRLQRSGKSREEILALLTPESVNQIGQEDLFRLSQENYFQTKDSLPSELGYTYSGLYKFFNRICPRGVTTTNFILYELFPEFAPPAIPMTEVYSLDSLKRLRELRFLPLSGTHDQWSLFPSPVQRALVHELSIEAKTPLEKMDSNNYKTTRVPSLGHTLIGMYEHQIQLMETAKRLRLVTLPPTREFLLDQIGFIRTSEALSHNLQAIHQALGEKANSTPYLKVKRETIRTLVNTTDPTALRLRLEQELLAVDQERATTSESADIETWRQGLLAVWALLDIAEWMPLTLGKTIVDMRIHGRDSVTELQNNFDHPLLVDLLSLATRQGFLSVIAESLIWWQNQIRRIKTSRSLEFKLYKRPTLKDLGYIKRWHNFMSQHKNYLRLLDLLKSGLVPAHLFKPLQELRTLIKKTDASIPEAIGKLPAQLTTIINQATHARPNGTNGNGLGNSPTELPRAARFVRRVSKNPENPKLGATALVLAILTAAVGMTAAGLGWAYLHTAQSASLIPPPTPQVGHPLIQIVWMSLATLLPVVGFAHSEYWVKPFHTPQRWRVFFHSLRRYFARHPDLSFYEAKEFTLLSIPSHPPGTDYHIATDFLLEKDFFTISLTAESTDQRMYKQVHFGKDKTLTEYQPTYSKTPDEWIEKQPDSLIRLAYEGPDPFIDLAIDKQKKPYAIVDAPFYGWGTQNLKQEMLPVQLVSETDLKTLSQLQILTDLSSQIRTRHSLPWIARLITSDGKVTFNIQRDPWDLDKRWDAFVFLRRLYHHLGAHAALPAKIYISDSHELQTPALEFTRNGRSNLTIPSHLIPVNHDISAVEKKADQIAQWVKDLKGQHDQSLQSPRHKIKGTWNGWPIWMWVIASGTALTAGVRWFYLHAAQSAAVSAPPAHIGHHLSIHFYTSLVTLLPVAGYLFSRVRNSWGEAPSQSVVETLQRILNHMHADHWIRSPEGDQLVSILSHFIQGANGYRIEFTYDTNAPVASNGFHPDVLVINLPKYEQLSREEAELTLINQVIVFLPSFQERFRLSNEIVNRWKRFSEIDLSSKEKREDIKRAFALDARAQLAYARLVLQYLNQQAQHSKRPHVKDYLNSLEKATAVPEIPKSYWFMSDFVHENRRGVGLLDDDGFLLHALKKQIYADIKVRQLFESMVEAEGVKDVGEARFDEWALRWLQDSHFFEVPSAMAGSSATAPVAQHVSTVSTAIEEDLAGHILAELDSMHGLVRVNAQLTQDDPLFKYLGFLHALRRKFRELIKSSRYRILVVDSEGAQDISMPLGTNNIPIIILPIHKVPPSIAGFANGVDELVKRIKEIQGRSGRARGAGNWPFMFPVYDWLADHLGTFIGCRVAPAVIESGGISLLVYEIGRYALGADWTMSLFGVVLWTVARVGWHFLHIFPEKTKWRDFIYTGNVLTTENAYRLLNVSLFAIDVATLAPLFICLYKPAPYRVFYFIFPHLLANIMFPLSFLNKKNSLPAEGSKSLVAQWLFLWSILKSPAYDPEVLAHASLIELGRWLNQFNLTVTQIADNPYNDQNIETLDETNQWLLEWIAKEQRVLHALPHELLDREALHTRKLGGHLRIPWKLLPEGVRKMIVKNMDTKILVQGKMITFREHYESAFLELFDGLPGEFFVSGKGGGDGSSNNPTRDGPEHRRSDHPYGQDSRIIGKPPNNEHQRSVLQAA